MNHEQHQDDAHCAHITVGASSGKAHSFATIMQRLKDRSPQERIQLRAQADAADLGHDAYALAHEYLGRGNYAAAKRWLRVAADHSVPGAEQALEEIDVRPPAGGLTGPAAVNAPEDPASWPPVPSRPVWLDSLEPWTSNWEHRTSGHATPAAEAESKGVWRRASYRAVDLQPPGWADAMRRFEKAWRTIAKLFAEAEQVQSAAKQIRQDAHYAADVILREAKQQAEVMIADAQRSASGLGEESFRAQAVGVSSRVRSCEVFPGDEEGWRVLLYDPRGLGGSAADESPKHPAGLGVDGMYIVQALWPLVGPGTAAGAWPVLAFAESRAVSIHRRQDDSLPVLPKALRVLAEPGTVAEGTPLIVHGVAKPPAVHRLTAASLHQGRGILALWSYNSDRDESPEGSHAPSRAASRQEEGVLTFRFIDVDQNQDTPSREAVRKALASEGAADQ